MFAYFLLIEIGFLAVMRSVFGTINGDSFSCYQIAIFQEGNKEFQYVLQSNGIVFSEI